MAYLHSMYTTIEVNFMIPGHTKFVCDGCFGLIKIKYKYTCVNCKTDIVDIVNQSANVNIAKTYENGTGFKWLDWKKFFAGSFKKLPGILSYRHFTFSDQFPGK